jgi:hypothetical protein
MDLHGHGADRGWKQAYQDYRRVAERGGIEAGLSPARVA